MADVARAARARGAAVSRVIGYVRVSTDRQRESGLGLEAQRVALRTRFPGTEIVSEVASGGKLRNRPKLSEVLAEIERGDTLAVAKLDRLCRNAGELIELADRAHRAGWSLVLLDMGLDTGTPMGRAMLQVAGAFAELERTRNSERVIDALDGRDDQLGKRRAAIRSLREAGRSIREIARMLDCEPTTVARELARVR